MPIDQGLISVRRGKLVGGLLIALLVGGVLGSVGAGYGTHVLGDTRVASTALIRDPNRIAASVSFQQGFAPVVNEALPAVVNLSSSKVVRTPGLAPLSNDPFFRQFFGNQFGPRTEREHNLGSGVIVSPDGYILTNNHMVEGASDIQVTLQDKREFKAKLVGTDPKTDLAVVKIDAHGLPTLPMGDSSRLEAGDFVLAIGEPFGLGGSVSMGIVSAMGRANLNVNPQGYGDFIQTDAPINPGNSGGAMVNVRGELVGINTFIVTSSGGSEGVGFAIPINMARPVMEQIEKHGKVTRAYLGVSIQEITPELAKGFHLAKTEGILIGDVTPGGPGERAGLKKGDIILDLNGQAVPDMEHFRLNVSSMSPGTTVRLRIFRDGREQEVSVVLAELPENETAANTQEPQQGVLQGLQVTNLTPQIADDLGLGGNTHGVVVTGVQPGSAAAEANLQRGDAIQEVNRQPVRNVSEFERAVHAAGRGVMLLLVNRGGSTMYIAVGP